MPVDGFDQAGVAELLPQRRHVHIEHLSRAVPVLVPGALEHLLAADHPARVAGQALQDGELLGSHGDLVPVHADLVRAQVHGERAVLQDLGVAGRLLAAAENGPDPGQQLLQPERLDQVVLGALVEGQHAVGFLAPRRHDDDGRVAGPAQSPADLHAVHVGQAEIEQENVGDRPVERRLSGRDAAGLVAGPGQAADQLSGDTRVVFHHEDPAETRVHGLHVKHETRRHPTRRRS